MNSIQIENIKLTIQKLKSDVSGLLVWAKNKDYDVPTIDYVLCYAENEKIDVLFLMSDNYYTKLGFKVCQKMIYEKLDEYKETNKGIRMVYLSDVKPNRDIYFIVE